MAFCTKCGKELREGDKFCFFCGEPVRNMDEAHDEELEGEKPEERRASVEEKTENTSGGTQSLKADKKFPLFLIIGVAAVLIVLIGVAFFGGKSSETDRQENIPASKEVKYDTYFNKTVYFSADYPQNYTVTEPSDNTVVFTEGEAADFQVVIEYAYHTVGDSMIYSAEDFYSQISADSKVLTDWLGTDDVQVLDSGQDKIAGKDCYQYKFEVQMDQDTHTGNLYIVDGDGEFGCYTFMSVVNEEADSSELYKEQAETMKESFRITGDYQADGYTVYRYDDLDMKFAVRDTAMGKTEQSGADVVIYPVDSVFTEANIWICDTSYEEGKKTVKEVLESGCNYLLTENEDGKYTSQIGTADCGRYDYSGVNAEYYENGKKYTLTVFTFVLEGKYWYIRTKYTDEYEDATKQALSDLLYSLKFGDSTGDDGAEQTAGETGQTQVKEVIEEIEKTDGYTGAATWEPLAVKDDFNGDGVEEFLSVYEVKNGNAFEVMYDVWSLKESGAVKLKSEVLFTEAGGNNGVVGIVEADGISYLAVYRYEPTGELFNNYYMYYPWQTTESAFGDSNIYLESHGSYDQEEKGKYIIGDTSVEKSKFDARYKELTNWEYRLSITEESTGNGVMTLEEID